MDGASRLIYMFTLREGAAIKGSHSLHLYVLMCVDGDE